MCKENGVLSPYLAAMDECVWNEISAGTYLHWLIDSLSKSFSASDVRGSIKRMADAGKVTLEAHNEQLFIVRVEGGK